MFRARETLVRLPKLFKPKTILQPKRPFCTKALNTNTNHNSVKAGETSVSTYDESYKQLEKLDFMKAAKILFTGPPSKKKFGLDFHLVQLFFACMPSLAVYLVAQYARYEIKRMEAELELKKKKEEEAKAKEIELNATEENEAGSVPGLLDVRVRLDKLEEIVKEIAVESKKQTTSGLTKDHGGGNEKKNIVTEASNSGASDSKKLVEKDTLSKERVSGLHTDPNASVQNQNGKTQDGGASQEAA